MIKSFHPILEIPTALRPLEKPKREIRTPFTLQRNPNTNYPEYQKSGSWKKSEILKYSLFLQYFYKAFQNRENIKKFRIFDQMARFISTRNSNQCRSHHQKTIQQHGSAAEYLESCKFDLKRADSEMNTYKYQLQKIKEVVLGSTNQKFEYISEESNLKGFGFPAFSKEDNRPTDGDYNEETIKESEKKIVSDKLLQKFSRFQSDQKGIEDVSASFICKSMISSNNLHIGSFTGYGYLGSSFGISSMNQENERKIEKKEQYFSDFTKNIQSMYIGNHNSQFP